MSWRASDRDKEYTRFYLRPTLAGGNTTEIVTLAPAMSPPFGPHHAVWDIIRDPEEATSAYTQIVRIYAQWCVLMTNTIAGAPDMFAHFWMRSFSRDQFAFIENIQGGTNGYVADGGGVEAFGSPDSNADADGWIKREFVDWTQKGNASGGSWHVLQEFGVNRTIPIKNDRVNALGFTMDSLNNVTSGVVKVGVRVHLVLRAG